MNIPNHVAIIMDGNGRWARQKGRPRIFGHIRGSSQVRPIVRECGQLGVKFLTLYCFSSENWGRPSGEVALLMRILQKYLAREVKTLMKNNIKLVAIGDLNLLPTEVLETLESTIQKTSHNTGLQLTFALSYGSRQEILSAVKKIALEVKAGNLDASSIDESYFTSHLQTSLTPDPDLVIRTSGEYRISNFLLWQSAYSEFFISEKLWPDFDILELRRAFEAYSKRTRRFGLTNEQILVPDAQAGSSFAVRARQ